MHDPSPASKPTSRFLRRRTFLAAIAILAFFVLATCQGVLPPTASPAQATQSTSVVEIPVTVEVTRIVMTERLIPTTPEPTRPCTPTSLAAAQEVVVAALLPLADPGTLGAAMASQAALSIAAQELNQQGGVSGHPLRVWSADVDVRRAAEVVGDAVHRQCAAAILVAASSDVSRAVLAAAEAYGVPVLVLDAVEDGLTAGGSEIVFRLAPTDSMLTGMYGAWLNSVGDYNGDSQVKSVLVIEDSAEAKKRAEVIGASMADLGIGYEILPVATGGDDYSSLVARIALMEPLPDAIFIRLNGDAALTLQRQLIENGIGPQKHSLIVTTRQALEAERFWQQLGDQGAFTVVQRVGPWSGTLGPGGPEFASRFAQLMGRFPEAPAFAAHDALYLVADAIQRSGALAADALIDALEATDLELAGGRYTFPYGAKHMPDTNDGAAWMWRQWLGAPLLFLQYTAPNQSAQNMAVLWPPDYATADEAVVRPPQLAAP